MDAVEQAVIATDLHGRVLFWSRFAERLYGWSSHEVIGRPITQVVATGASARQAEEIMAALARGDRWQGEFEVTRKDGSTFTASVTDSPLLVDGEVVGVVGVSVDVSERRRLEEALRTSERQFRTLFESIDEGFCLAEIVVDEERTVGDRR
ncbi:PAS domain-containing protein, partial [Kineosporia sp. R_H_3]|uniref:PAS domain-containing protein n=1 Tax=Kineosporia sp. R_H_3 TaxID=1961848 RepID=UPI0013045140